MHPRYKVEHAACEIEQALGPIDAGVNDATTTVVSRASEIAHRQTTANAPAGATAPAGLRALLAGLAAAACSGCADAGSESSSPRDAQTENGMPNRPACTELELRDLVAEAARFSPGSGVNLRLTLMAADAPCSTALDFRVSHLGEPTHDEKVEIQLSPGIEQTAVLRWTAPAEDFRGYLALVSTEDGSQKRATAIDVSSSPFVYPRYGYLSVFPPGQTQRQSSALVATLAEAYHINLLQFYDWFWRHEDLLPRAPDGSIEETWTDLFDRTHSLSTIRDLIDAAHAENAAALAYVAMYAAREGYEQRSGVSPAWGLFETLAAERQVALAFAGNRYLFLFDPSNPAWQERMASEYVESVEALGFDGVHVDQFGPRPTLYRADGSPVELNETFAPFLESIDAALGRAVPERDACVFNLVQGAVDGYAVRAVAETPACDVLYSEIWFDTNTYEKLRAYVEQLRAIGRKRAVVLALYPQYGEDVGLILQAEDARLEGVTIASDHSGYTGSGFVAGFDEIGDSITWTASTSEDPTVTFVFRYVNATGSPATRTLVLDGQVIGKLTFGARSAWSDWAFDAWLQQAVSPGEHQVSLVYAPGDVGEVNIDRMTLGAFDEDSVRLQNAVVFASGATPIQLGDDLQSLSHEYFPNRSKTLSVALRRALRDQYRFITAHESLLFAPEVEPITDRLARVEALSPGHQLIAEGSGGIWTLLRRAPAGDVIHLVNLVGVDNDLWRDPAPTPEPQTDILIRYQVDDASAVTRVLWGSPELELGELRTLDFEVVDGYIQFQVPRLEYWDVILVRR